MTQVSNPATLDVTKANALDHFETIFSKLNGRRLVIFTDYDGTLSPIVEDPNSAFIPPKTSETLNRLAHNFTVGIITGRSLQKIKDFVKLPNLYYAGSHGLDIIGPDESFKYTPGEDFRKIILDLQANLQEAIDSDEDLDKASVESSGFHVSVHYRRLNPEFVPKLRCLTQSVVENSGYAVKICGGKMVYEVRPICEWNKGEALTYLYRQIIQGEEEKVEELKTETSFVPIYLGDDTSDEDAFHALKAKLGHGIGILVSDTNKETHAEYSLRDPLEVEQFLSKIVESDDQGSSREHS